MNRIPDDKIERSVVGRYICQSKKRYVSKKKAWAAALTLYIQTGKYLAAYGCLHCHKFHLTSRPGIEPPNEWKQGFNEWFGSEVYEITHSSTTLSGS